MSVYVGPRILPQMTADTPEEMALAAIQLGIETESVSCRLSIRTRDIAVSMGAIELSRREFVAKLEEIAANGRGSGPNLAQICR